MLANAGVFGGSLACVSRSGPTAHRLVGVGRPPQDIVDRRQCCPIQVVKVHLLGGAGRDIDRDRGV